MLKYAEKFAAKFNFAKLTKNGLMSTHLPFFLNCSRMSYISMQNIKTIAVENQTFGSCF